MRFKTTIILAGVLLLLSAYLYFIEVPGKRKAEGESKVFNLDWEKVSELRLRLGDEITVCTKNNEGEWEITEPMKAEANQPLVENVVSSLKNLEINRVVESPPKDLSLYGLVHPNVEATVKSAGEPQGVTLQFGWKGQVGDSLYAKLKDDNRVLLVSYELGKKIGKKASQLRDRRVVIFDRSNLKRIEFSYPDRKIILARQEEGWQILEPIKARASEFEVGQLILAITAMKIEKFIDDPTDLGQYGLTHPRVKVTLGLEGKEAGPITLLGKNTKDNKLTYAKRESKHPVYLIQSYFIEDFTKEANQLRDKKFFSFDRAEVSKIEIRHGKNILTLTKDPQGDWQILEAGEAKAIKSEVDELLSALEELEVTKFVDDNPRDLRPYGLDQPILQESLWLGANKMETLLVGKEEKSKKEHFIKKDSEAPVYLAKKGMLAQLIRNLDELKEPEE
jgi:hypothetical protein